MAYQRNNVPADETPEEKQERLMNDLLARSGVTQEQLDQDKKNLEEDATRRIHQEQEGQSLRGLTRRRS